MAKTRVMTVNVGNTHTNAILWSDFRAELEIGPWPSSSNPPLRHQDWVNTDVIVLGGVVPRYLDVLARKLKSFGDIFIFRKTLRAPIQIAPKPAKNVGDDRIASALGALCLDQTSPWIVVDLGTATTVNFVRPAAPGKLPCFEGGLIFPGIGMSLAAMHANTAQLPEIRTRQSDAPQSYIGKNTADAMRLGAFHALVGAVTECIRGQLKEMGGEPRVALTGGGLTESVRLSITRQFPGIVEPAPTLVHLGMYAAWDFQQKRRHG